MAGKYEIKPKEIVTLKYWLHLGILAVVVLLVLQLLKGGEMFTIKNILWSIPLLGIGDIFAHTVLKID